MSSPPRRRRFGRKHLAAPFPERYPLPEENRLSRQAKKRGNPATTKTYQLGCMGLMSVPITSADGYVLPHQSDNPSLILTNEGDSLSSINGPYTSPSPHIQNPLNALLHGCKQEFSVEQKEIYMVEDVQPLQLSACTYCKDTLGKNRPLLLGLVIRHQV